MGVQATKISCTGQCLFLHLLTTWYRKGRKISLPDQCLLLSAPYSPLVPGPRDVVTTAVATSTPGTLSWPPLLLAETANFSKCSVGCRGRSLPPSEEGCCCSQGSGDQSRRVAAEIEPTWTTLWWQTRGFTDLRPDPSIGRADCFCKGCAQAVAGQKANTAQKGHGEWNGPSIKVMTVFCDLFLERRGKKTKPKPTSAQRTPGTLKQAV